MKTNKTKPAPIKAAKGGVKSPRKKKVVVVEEVPQMQAPTTPQRSNLGLKEQVKQKLLTAKHALEMLIQSQKKDQPNVTHSKTYRWLTHRA